jgi:hypothetical protein
VPIPDIQRFEVLLSSLCLTKPTGEQGYKSVAGIQPERAITQDGKHFTYPLIPIWYRETNDLPFDSLIRRIQAELQSTGHAHTPAVVHTVLTAYALLPRVENGSVKALNELLSSRSSVELFQTYVLPIPPPPNYHFRFGSFTVGKVRIEDLNSRSRRALSDFHELYGDRLRGRLAIERDPVTIQVLDCWNLAEVLASSAKAQRKPNLEYLIVDSYYNSVANELFAGFWALLEQQQEATVAIGSGYLGSEQLRILPGCQAVTIFLRTEVKRGGWVAPNAAGLIIDLAQTNKTIPEAERKLKEYRVGGFSISGLHSTFEIFARFIARARKHEMADRLDEAFLHFVIALDLLLGEKDASNKSIGNRVAVLTYRHFNRSLEDQRRVVESMYDKRSKYVHAGTEVSSDDLEVIRAICAEVLACLLRLYKAPENHELNFVRGKWFKNLDYITSALLAGKDISDEELQANGIDVLENVS